MITNIFRVFFTKSFKPLVLDNDIEDDLNIDADEIGIYIHIPFCLTLCSFCLYNKIKYEKNIAKSYKKALLKEIEMGSKLFKSKKNVNSIYFGGGTPSLMLDYLEEIVAQIKKNFNVKDNIGIELHPRDINIKDLEKLKNIGFDMVSVGIQSFQRESLNSLGREYIDGIQKVNIVREVGFKVIDVDLIFGIKGQTEESLEKDFITASEAGATQISTYPFIDFSYSNNKNKPLGRKKKKELLNSLEKISSDIGYERTAVWTFAKRNTMKYSSITRDSFIGFGASATSLTKKIFKINTFSVSEYIESVNKDIIPTALNMRFDKRTRQLYWLFWNAYTLILDRAKFKEMFNENIEDSFGFEIKMVLLLGIVDEVEGNYKLTKRGAYIYHLIEQKYTNQYIDRTWSIAREKAWPEKIELY